MKIEELKIHFFYLVTILTLALIIVSTGLWTDKENFTVFLTNAATMISIVLGLVAIFYSFISNTSLSQSLGNITTVSNGVEKSNQLVNQFVAQAEQLNKANLQNSERMATLSLNVDEQLDSLNTLLKELDIKSTSLQTSVSLLPIKLDKIENRFFEGVKANDKASETNSDHTAIHFTTSNIRSMLDRAGVAQILLLYVCQYIYKNRLTIDLSKIQPFLQFNNSYFMGMMAVFQSLQLLKRDWKSSESDFYFSIPEMNSYLASFDIEENVTSYLNNDSNVFGRDKSESYLKAFESIKEYLESVEKAN